MINDRIDVIVPAHRAHETLRRTLESLAVQSIAGSCGGCLYQPGTTKDIFDVFAKRGYFSLPEGCEPVIGFDEFLRRMKTEDYDPDHIYDVWAEMAASPEMRARMEMNEETGVCGRGYSVRS